MKNIYDEPVNKARYYGNEDSGQYDPRAQYAYREGFPTKSESRIEKELETLAPALVALFHTMVESDFTPEESLMLARRWNGQIPTMTINVDADSGVIYESNKR